MSTVSEFEFEKLLEELEALRAENAKLIAERDMLKLCADQNEDEVKKMMAERKEYLANKILDASDKKLLDRLLAEREAMMKQEPDYYGYDGRYYGDKSTAEIFEGKQEFQELFERPLPAQQIPEGYAITDEIRSALELAIELLNDDCSFSKADALKAMLSASQPKGDM